MIRLYDELELRAYGPVESGPTAQESSMGPYRIADASRSSGVARYGENGTSMVEAGVARCLLVIY